MNSSFFIMAVNYVVLRNHSDPVPEIGTEGSGAYFYWNVFLESLVPNRDTILLKTRNVQVEILDFIKFVKQRRVAKTALFPPTRIFVTPNGIYRTITYFHANSETKLKH